MDPLRFEPLNLKSCILIATQKPKFTMEWRDPLRKSDLGDCHKLSSALGLWMSTTFVPIPYPKDGEKGIFTDFGPNWQSGWGPQLTTNQTRFFLNKSLCGIELGPDYWTKTERTANSHIWALSWAIKSKIGSWPGPCSGSISIDLQLWVWIHIPT